ncbi:hypothetical protein H4R19_005758 [Coemansia spiralis]|nr:hypothetical protein H4R19_005758 [Coemansia spiralis]
MKAAASWALAAAWAAGSLTSALAHSWVDCVKYDPTTKLCLGYSRGYRGRADVEPNALYTYRFNAMPTTQPMCSPNGQSAAASYTAQFPMAVVQPGETMYTTWQANGHLNNTAPTRVDILYYDDPGREFAIASERTVAKVAGSFSFATDGNCYVPSNPNSECLGRWVVPKELAPGRTYRFVWFWYFNKNPAGEWYSTCFDLQVEPKSHTVGDRPLSAYVPGTCPPGSYMQGITDAVRAELAQTTSLAPVPDSKPPPSKPAAPPARPPPPAPTTVRRSCDPSTRRRRRRQAH